ncbi:MAG: glycosyltransferase [Bacteroidetes bacterium]|nr:glycosyltransferase [Bacteroidota bacterium]
MKNIKISIITPSYNQAEYLECTIKSVLEQNYPNLEYIIIDGGSTDGSLDIIKKYESHLAYWVSEPDNGQAHAINKGLKRASGDWLGWQNSDDLYYPDTFKGLAEIISKNIHADLIVGNMMLVDSNGNNIRDIKYVQPTYNSLRAEGMVLANQSSFWSRSVHSKIGWLNEELQYSFDYEWFLRLLYVSKAVCSNEMWGAFRLHGSAKTALNKELFGKENKKILGVNNMSPLDIRFFKLRRLILLFIQGDFSYVLRGMFQRCFSKGDH